MKFYWKILLVVIFAAILFSGIITFAQENEKTYTLLQPLPGMEQTMPVKAILPAYLAMLFKFMLVLAGALAVLMIVFSGIMYITSGGNASQVEKAKSRIWSAIGGLVLAVSAYLILYTINPNLVNLDLGIQPITLTKRITPTEPELQLVIPTGRCLQDKPRAYVWVDFNKIQCNTSDYIAVMGEPARYCGTRPSDTNRSFKCCLLNIEGQDTTKWCGVHSSNQ